VSLLVMSVPVTVVVALAVALGLHRLRRLEARSAWAAMYFLPFSVSLVAAALVWQWIYDPVYGVLNHFLGALGVPPLKWLQSLDLVRPSLAAVNVWARLGFDTMIFLAALPGHPAEYYEAAAIDGASVWQALWRITLRAQSADRDGGDSRADLQLQDLRHGCTRRRRAGPRAPARR